MTLACWLETMCLSCCGHPERQKAGDSFQLQILEDTLGFSVYQSPAYGLNVDEEDGTRNFVSTLPQSSVTSDEISIGSVGRPPVPEINFSVPGEKLFR